MKKAKSLFNAGYGYGRVYPLKSRLKIKYKEIDYSKEYFTFTALEDSAVKIFGGRAEDIQTGNPMPCVNLEYSKNNGKWIVWDYTDISLLSGDTLKLKGNNPNGFSIGELESITQIHTFYQSTGKMDISGNIMSLLYGDDFQNKKEIPCEGCFIFLFGFDLIDVTSFVSAENLILPATTLADNCYLAMFGNCTSLTSAPELPATTLADWCYGSMFLNCNSLTTAPELPATTLANSCYSQMFYNCTSLNYIKMLATDISADSCLTNWVKGVSPTGKFIKSAGVNIPTGISGIPSGWTVEEVGFHYSKEYFTFTALEDSVIKIEGLSNTGFTTPIVNLEYSKNNGEWIAWDFTDISLSMGDTLRFKGNNPNGFSSMNNGCYNTFSNSTGKVDVSGNIMSLLYSDDFQNKTDLPCVGCFAYLFGTPYGNVTTFVNAENLILPATTLTDACYGGMFSGCASLTTAPELPATTLVAGCYRYMFYYCTSLNYIKMLATDISASNCLNNWVSNVSPTGTFVKSAGVEIPIATSENGYNGIPEGWTVQEL